VDKDSYVPIGSIPKFLHEAFQGVVVLCDDIIRFPDNVFTGSLPYDHSEYKMVRNPMARRLTEALHLRVFPDETGTFKSLLSDLSNDIAHRFNFAKVVLFSHEAVNVTQFLEKTKD
jgi:hypothetical protein